MPTLPHSVVRPAAVLLSDRVGRALLSCVSLFIILLAPTLASAQIYHSPGDDGQPAAGPPTVAEGGVQPVYLYVSAGTTASSAGTACDTGTGNEVCGIEVLLTATTGLTFVGFTPDGAADVVTNLSATSFMLGALDTQAPTPGPTRLGVLQVNAVSGGGVDIESGEWVGADLSSTTIAPDTLVSVPEPGEVALLVAGLGLLLGLARRRDARRTRRDGAVHRPPAPVLCVSVAVASFVGAGMAAAAPLIVNEFNAVAGGEFLNGGTLGTDGDGNSIDPPGDTYFGRVAGNGGDWIELAVIGDHLDIRGWKLVICENAVCDEELVFTNDPVWSDLRAGTILTVSEDEPTDLSFNPGGGDWHMNVQAHNAGPGTYISANNFPVSHSEWRMHIEDDQGNRVFGPIGEHVPIDPVAGCYPPQDDINSGEIFRLEQDPSALIDPCHLSLNDWEDGVISTFGSPNAWNSGLAVQSFANLRNLVPFPDRDGDQIPDDGDFSGIAGDNPCVGGSTSGCDDNCGGIQNAAQTDTGGPGGPDGQGDVCQCGDPTGDDDVTAADVLELRQQRLGLVSNLTVPERCSVHSNGQCSLVDLVVLDRTVQNPSLAPGIAPVCQAAAIPTDQSDLMFDPNRLVDIEIVMDLADWNAMRVEGNSIFDLFLTPSCGTAPWPDPFNFYPDPIGVDGYNQVTVDGHTLEDVAIRKKGFQGSLSSTHPSLKVKFDELVGGQQLNSMDRLTLNNNNQDPTHVKSCLSYFFMRKAGVPAPRCNLAHVKVYTENGGAPVLQVDRIFTHVESIKDPFLRRNFGSDAGRLYEGTISDFWAGPFRNTIEPKTPEAAADTSEIDALMAALMNNGLSDAQRLTAIEGLVDVDDFLTFWAAEGLVGHWDGYADDQNNFWFYVDPSDGLIRFIPWGPDDTWGRGNFLRGGDPNHAAAIVPRAALPRRLYEIASTKAQYLARLQDLLDNVFDEAELLAEIDRMEAQIVPVMGNITTELNKVRTFVNTQRASVQAEINSPPAGFGTQPDDYCF